MQENAGWIFPKISLDFREKDKWFAPDRNQTTFPRISILQGTNSINIF
jgi:hypothetical protein